MKIPELVYELMKFQNNGNKKSLLLQDGKLPHNTA